jgi:hypothetical protein
MKKIVYKIPASCNTRLISTSKGIFKINEKLSQADRKYLQESGFFEFDIVEVNEAVTNEQKSKTKGNETTSRTAEGTK